MELFSEEDRLSLIYGKNGSRKSTISKAIHKAKGDTVEDIERADLYDGENKAYSDIQGVHVFNEDYVNSRVKIREDGLNTIKFCTGLQCCKLPYYFSAAFIPHLPPCR